MSGAGPPDGNTPKARLVGINHVALEVGDIEQALAFYGSIFEFRLRGRGPGRAFVDMGDQFLALVESDGGQPDDHRHFGLVVDDRAAVRRRAEAAGAAILDTGSLDFLDPWATASRSSNTATFSSPRPGRCCRRSGWRRTSRQTRSTSCAKRAWPASRRRSQP